MGVRMKVLLIIPAYNEGKNIERVVDNLINNYPQYDYVVINDGSKDDTEYICKKRGYNYIMLPANLGIGGAVQTGYLYAEMNDYDITVQYDGDGQHNAEYIEAMISEIMENRSDMVVGSRFILKEGFQTSGIRRMGIKWLSRLIYCCYGLKVHDTTSGFRACSKQMVHFFGEEYAQDYPEPEAIVRAYKHGFRVSEIPVVMNARVEGRSTINWPRSAYYMVKVTLAILLSCIQKR